MNVRTAQKLAEAYRAISLLLINDEEWQQIRDFIERRDLNAAMDIITRAKPKHSNKIADIFITAYEDSVNDVYKELGLDVRAKVEKAKRKNRFVVVPHSAKYIKQHVAELVVDVVNQQVKSLRRVIAERYDPTKRPEILVRQIKSIVGLTDREMDAVANREEKLRMSGWKESRVQRETARYSEKLHQARAERIARTETVFIETEAKETAWQIAQDDGVLPPTAIKEWVSSVDACEFCQDMDEESVPLGEMFIAVIDHKGTQKIVKGPPLHPHCYCQLVVRNGDD